MGADDAIISGLGRPAIPKRPNIEARLLDYASQEERDGHSTRCRELTQLVEQCCDKSSDESASTALAWRPTCAGKAFFPLECWLAAMHQLIRHPEHSSTDIRRADILQETGSFTEVEVARCADGQGPCPHSAHIRRELKPRRPNLDAVLRQDCYLVHSTASGTTFVIYIPLDEQLRPVVSAEQVPFYHPSVRGIAFAYTPLSAQNGSAHSTKEKHQHVADIEIFVSPFDATFNAANQPQHRLSRTSLRLVELQARLSWGELHGYKKRIEHDCIVKREDYMDLYQELREKHSSRLISKWVESTDAQKHVFEDVGIATFLMLLWRDMFPSREGEELQESNGTSSLSTVKRWGRPRSFVDVGCGNGLLVHLLNAEGYTGFGIDIRARKTWEMVQELEGSADLREESLSAPLLASLGGEGASRRWPAGSFLIGNHADELTSWLPLIAASDEQCPGFINIPCCRFLLNGIVSNQMKYRLGPDEMAEVRRLVPPSDLDRTLAELQRGPPTESADSTSRNVAFLRYISHVHLLAGWALEKEALRIPSTKNWCLVGRRRAFAGQDDMASVAARQEASERVGLLAEKEGASWRARTTIDAVSARLH